MSPSHAAASEEDRPLVGFSPWGAAFRVRVATYVVLVAVPAALIAGWAFDRLAVESKLDQADAALGAELRASMSELRAAAKETEARATRLATSARVQTALARRDRAALRRLIVENPRVAVLSPRGVVVAGRLEPLALPRSVDVVAGDRRIGRIVASLPLDDELLARLEREAALSAGDRLAIVRGGRIVAGPPGWRTALDVPRGRAEDVHVAATSYRAVSTAVFPASRTDLVVFRPRESIERLIADTRRRVLIVELIGLLFVASVAYALAPAIARGRFLFQQRAQSARAMAHVADGVFLLDAAGRVRSWNPAAEAITGLRVETVRGRSLAEVIPEWPRVAQLAPVVRGAEPASERPRPRTLPLEVSGRNLWVSISGAEFSEGTVYAFRDVTEERQLEELRTHFVATVSHELRTPLAGIYGAAMTLQRHDVVLAEEQRKHLLSVVADQSERLTHIVDDILLASQLDAGTVRIAEESFDAAELAREVVDAARAGLHDDPRIDLRTAPSLPAVAGDGDKARQILANLVDNAIKYSPNGGGVQVEVEQRDDFVQFVVRDEGLGIAASDRERIFEKFYRADPSMSRGIGGTGLGLFLCRELVDRMGGRIWVESELGAGSTFTFELPAAHSV
jgi:PAS domain S-box-containing protein